MAYLKKKKEEVIFTSQLLILSIKHSTDPINLILNCAMTDMEDKDQWINFFEMGVLVGSGRVCTCKKWDYEI